MSTHGFACESCGEDEGFLVDVRRGSVKWASEQDLTDDGYAKCNNCGYEPTAEEEDEMCNAAYERERTPDSIGLDAFKAARDR